MMPISLFYFRTISSKTSEIVSLALLVILISNCSTVPPIASTADWQQQRAIQEELRDWMLRGRVNVQYENESHTPRIQWHQRDKGYNIRLWGTFNAGNTRIIGQRGDVTMEHDGKVFKANSPEDLILQQLGYELPVSYLEYWVRGMPAPNSRADFTLNEQNQLSQINQDGWTIKYKDHRQYGNFILPRRVEVTRPRNDIRLRFVSLTWKLDLAAD